MMRPCTSRHWEQAELRAATKVLRSRIRQLVPGIHPEPLVQIINAMDAAIRHIEDVQRALCPEN